MVLAKARPNNAEPAEESEPSEKPACFFAWGSLNAGLFANSFAPAVSKGLPVWSVGARGVGVAIFLAVPAGTNKLHEYACVFACVAVLALVVSFTGCKRSSKAGGFQSSSDGSVALLGDNHNGGPGREERYPHARWRLADPTDLRTVVLWVSHILIRHQGSDRNAAFTENWPVLPPAPERSREEALALANEIAARAADDPSRFAELARQTSEDIVTAPEGGSLGGVTAINLLGDPAVLDALAAIKPGEVTRPVGTRHGFHVFLRRPPPPRIALAARRFVVPYDNDVDDSRLDSGVAQQMGHSRTEAQALAAELAAQVRADPKSFEPIWAKYPSRNSFDAHGDIGAWTNQDPGDLAREREILVKLPFGEPSQPIDSPAGFQVFVRRPSVPRQEYVVEILSLGFRRDVSPSGWNSRAAAFERIRSIAQRLDRDPSAFDELRRENCCDDLEVWREGRESSSLLASVEHLPIGGIVKAPIERAAAFLLPRRADPTRAQASLFALPAPDRADVMEVAKKYSGPGFQSIIRKLAEDSVDKLALDPVSTAQFKAAHEELAASFRAGEPSATRQKGLTLFREELRRLLPADAYDEYWEVLTSRVTTKLLSMR